MLNNKSFFKYFLLNAKTNRRIAFPGSAKG